MSLPEQLKTFENEKNRVAILITGDFNVDKTNWKTMSSTEYYEDQFLTVLASHNFQQIFDCQLDVLVVNHPDNFLSCERDKTIFNQFSLRNFKFDSYVEKVESTEKRRG